MKNRAILAKILPLISGLVTVVLVTFFIMAAWVWAASSWQGPTESPPQGNPSGFIQASPPSAQEARININGDAEVGNLIIKPTGSFIFGLEDPISSWPDLCAEISPNVCTGWSDALIELIGTGLWQKSGGTGPDIYYNTGDIGMGTENPGDDGQGRKNVHIYSNNGSRLIIDGAGSSALSAAFLDFVTRGDGTKTVNNVSTQGWNFMAYSNSYLTSNLKNDLRIRYYNGTVPTDVIHLTDTGNVGIGITAPDSFLHVETGDARGTLSAGYTTRALGRNSIALGKGIDVTGDNSIGIRLNTGQKDIAMVTNPGVMAILDGNVGIGTTAPTNKLEIQDSGRNSVSLSKISSDTADPENINLFVGFERFWNSVDDNPVIKGWNNRTGQPAALDLQGQNGGIVIVPSRLQVGIGAKALNPSSNTFFLVTDSGANSNRVAIEGDVYYGTAIKGASHYGWSGYFKSPDSSPSPSYKGVFIDKLCLGSETSCQTSWSGVGGNTWLVNNGNVYRNPSYGNVGIGTSAPYEEFVVQGAAGNPAFIAAAGGADEWQYSGVDLWNTGTNYGSASSPGNTLWRLTHRRSNSTVSPVEDSFQIHYKDSNNNWINPLTILPNGNVGIGTADPKSSLDITGNIKLNSNPANGGAQVQIESYYVTPTPAVQGKGFGGGFWVNEYYDPVADTMRRTRTGPSGVFNMKEDGHWRLTSSPSGAAGSDANVNAVLDLFIQNNGQVGIGTATLASGDKLTVAGNIKASGTICANNGSVCLGGSGSTGWTDGGTNVYLTTTSDNVGIGTASPSSKLDVAGGGISGNYGLIPNYASWNSYGTGDGGAGIYNDSGTFKKLMIVGNNSAGGAVPGGREVGIWDNLTVNGNTYVAGNVGIGKAPSSQKLDVAGNINGTGLCIGGDCKTSWSQVGGSAWTDSGTAIYNTTLTDNVGIGTASPSNKLDVVGFIEANGSSTIVNTSPPSADQVTGWKIGLWGNQYAIGVAGYTLALKAGPWVSFFYGNPVGNGTATTPDTGAYAAFSPTTNYLAGNVGIGKTAPSQKLDVAGNINGTGLCIGGDCKTSWSQVGGSAWTDSGTAIYNTTLTDKVGIGTANPVNKLDVAGDVAITGKHALRGNDSWLRLNQDGAFTSGVHTPGVFAPGSLNVGGAGGWGNPGAGNVWIAGNVGIGTAAPAAKLDVNGQVKISGGSPGLNKILTSDASGLATWKTLNFLTCNLNTSTWTMDNGCTVGFPGSYKEPFIMYCPAGYFAMSGGVDCGVNDTVGISIPYNGGWKIDCSGIYYADSGALTCVKLQ
ncbi:MAG: hypothetical protein WC675_05740 [Patescibacteria group bacterium]|jgi:hypothetical protein